MTVHSDTLEEYVWLNTYMQGNVNIPGLVFDDLLQENLDCVGTPYTVNIDFVESGFSISEDFNPYHHLKIAENLAWSEIFGFPSRIKQVAVNVVHQPLVAPVELCFMQVDIVHGVDMFWEEVIETMHFPTESNDVARLAFWHMEWLYEDIDFEFEMAPGTSGVWKGVFPTSSDLINMRHNVETLYYFNNLADDRFFTYDWPMIGWQHNVDDGFVITCSTLTYMGFAVVDYLWNQDVSGSAWIGSQLLESGIFTWDTGKAVHGFSDAIFESVQMDSVTWAPFLERMAESLGLVSDISGTTGKSSISIAETLQLKDVSAIVAKAMVLIQDIVYGSDGFITESVVRDYNEVLADGFGISVLAVANYILDHVIEDSLSGDDSTLTKWLMRMTVSENISTDDGVN